jgi:hypothetical protein
MSIQIEENHFKHPDYDVDKTLTTPIDQLMLDDISDDDLPELENIQKGLTLEEDEEDKKEEEETPQKVMLRELESMYASLSQLDMKVVRRDMKSKFMKPTIDKLHRDFFKDFKDIPRDDVIYLRCCELMGYIGIPPVIAEHEDLEGKKE